MQTNISGILTPTIFIALGVIRHPQYHNGIYDRLSDAGNGEDGILAEASANVYYGDQLEQIAWKMLKEYPGVIAYEVYEQFGRWWAGHILTLEPDCMFPCEEACAREMRLRMAAFFAKVSNSAFDNLEVHLIAAFNTVEYRKEEYK